MAALDETMGVMLIGVVIASVLYGFTCVQTWYYFTHYPSDRWYTKLLVLAAFCSDTGHQALITHYIYTYLVTYFGDFDELRKVVISLVVEVFFNGFTAFLVQCFMAVRVYKLSNKNWLLTGAVMAMILLEWILILVFSVKAVPLGTYAGFATLNPISMTINAAAAAGDILITVCLCYLLQKSRTGFEKSDWTINKLIMYSVNTGLLTSLCALGSLICISVWPHAFYYLAFYYNIGRLYCNSLLATLNARRGLRKGVTSTGQEDTSRSEAARPTRKSKTRSFIRAPLKAAPGDISIKIDTTQEFMRDEPSPSLALEMKACEAI